MPSLSRETPARSSIARPSLVRPSIARRVNVRTLSVAGAVALSAAVASVVTMIFSHNSAAVAQAETTKNEPAPIVVTPIVAAAGEAPTRGAAVPVAFVPEEAIRRSSVARPITLHAGQGFRFADAAVVPASDVTADFSFVVTAPSAGGPSVRFDGFSRELRRTVDPGVPVALPTIKAAHVAGFDAAPRVATLTTGDVGKFPAEAFFDESTRYWLVQAVDSSRHVVRVNEAHLDIGRPDTWSISFTSQPVAVALGAPGGRAFASPGGKLIYQQGWEPKVLVELDLATGTRRRIADGKFPSRSADGRTLYQDASGQLVLADAAGKTIRTLSLNASLITPPEISPDGKWILTSEKRATVTQYMDMTLPGMDAWCVVVYDLDGKEKCNWHNVDDPTWTPDGKIVATGEFDAAGLFLLDPDTHERATIDERVTWPQQPAVSPDGKTIAFVAGHRVWTCETDGKNRKQLWDDGQEHQAPTFSPDGKSILLAAGGWRVGQFVGTLHVVDRATGAAQQVPLIEGSAVVPDANGRVVWMK